MAQNAINNYQLAVRTPLLGVPYTAHGQVTLKEPETVESYFTVCRAAQGPPARGKFLGEMHHATISARPRAS